MSIDYISTFSLLDNSPADWVLLENQEISDYLKEGEVGFKKPKTKKKRPKGRVEELAQDDSLVVVKEENGMDIEPVVPRVRDLNVNFVDDDDLQAALARERRTKVKKVKKLTPEEIAQRGTDLTSLHAT